MWIRILESSGNATLFNYYNLKMNRQRQKDITYFKMAIDISDLSRDERTKVGSVIIDIYGKLTTSGYNGPSSSCNDKNIDFSGKEFDYAFSDLSNINIAKLGIDINNETILHDTFISRKFTKKPFMIHAETNAILTTDNKSGLNGATMYVTTFPCPACANLIAQSGIKVVKTLNGKSKSFNSFVFDTLAIFSMNGIILEVYSKEELGIKD